MAMSPVTFVFAPSCSQDYPIALDPLLLGEQKHDHDFLFSFPFENVKAIMAA